MNAQGSDGLPLDVVPHEARMAPQLWWYFGVLIALYALAVAAFWPQAVDSPTSSCSWH